MALRSMSMLERVEWCLSELENEAGRMGFGNVTEQSKQDIYKRCLGGNMKAAATPENIADLISIAVTPEPIENFSHEKNRQLRICAGDMVCKLAEQNPTPDVLETIMTASLAIREYYTDRDEPIEEGILFMSSRFHNTANRLAKMSLSHSARRTTDHLPFQPTEP